jgi:hypothetical protein
MSVYKPTNSACQSYLLELLGHQSLSFCVAYSSWHFPVHAHDTRAWCTAWVLSFLCAPALDSARATFIALQQAARQYPCCRGADGGLHFVVKRHPGMTLRPGTDAPRAWLLYVDIGSSTALASYTMAVPCTVPCTSELEGSPTAGAGGHLCQCHGCVK